MRTAPALALATVGAILAYAVNVSVPGLDLDVVGSVLTLVGLLWLAIEIGLEIAATREPRPRRLRETRRASAPERPAAPRYDPVLPEREARRADVGDRRDSGGDATEPTRVIPRRRS